MELGLLDLTVEDVYTHQVKLAVQQKAYEHAALAVGTTKKQLQEMIEQNILDGGSTQELAKAIKDQFAIDSRVRSLRIARTELTDTINDGTTRALAKEGYAQKQWSTVVDGKERPSHAAANGQTVGIHDVFRVGGAACKYPGDDVLPPGERINCRCVTVGAGMPEDRVRRIGRRFLTVHGSLEKKFMLSLQRAFLSQGNRVLSRLP